MTNFLQWALGGTTNQVVNTGRNTVSSIVNSVLGQYGVGGVTLANALNVAQNTGWDNIDPLIDFAFRVRMDVNTGFLENNDGYFQACDVSMPELIYGSQLSEQVNKYYVAGHRQPELAITFHEDSYAQVMQLYRKLQILAFDPATGIYGLPSQYKQSIYVDLMFYNGTPAYTIEHINCSVKSLSRYAMNTEGHTILKPVMTFNVERISTTSDNPESNSPLNQILNGALSSTFNAIGGVINQAISTAF